MKFFAFPWSIPEDMTYMVYLGVRVIEEDCLSLYLY
jgi:hypothetical protein